MRKTFIIAAVTIVVLAGSGLYMTGAEPINAALSAVLTGEKSKQDGGRRSRRLTPVDVAVVNTEVAEIVFTTTGEVVADDRVMLSAEVNGRVEKILVDGGATVAVGEPILRFDSASQRAAVSAAEAQLNDARRSYARVEQLAQRDLAATNELRARFSIPERYADEVGIGAPLRLSLPNGRTVDGVLSILSPLTDRATRSVKAEASLDATSGFRPGSFVRVEVILDRTENALFVPETAVLYQGLTTAVFKVVDGKAIRVALETGMRRDGMIEVRSGELAAGDTVVAEGLQKVTDGRPVQPRGNTIADQSSGVESAQ